MLTYISPPLLPILKELNAYSNNVFHDFAEAAGGVGFVQAVTAFVLLVFVADLLVRFYTYRTRLLTCSSVP